MIISLVLSSFLTFNNDTTDTPRQIDEVVVVSSKVGANKHSVKGTIASIDEHLSELSHVTLVRRGSYASEPIVNNMASERVSVTIDGMKIFYACTDKMDPVTSYVESSNLQSISLNSGLNGNPQSTGNIGGSLDLKLHKTGFNKAPFQLNASAGYESNGNIQIYGADAAFSSSRFYTNFGGFFRKANNYKAGGNKEIPFSQFQKYNIFINAGYKTTQNDKIEGTIIFDKATNVGYPALAMDVAKAEAVITSLAYQHIFNHPLIASWETKAYYNHITHIMDDTKRPDVQIHMDMPGKSYTTGIYSILYLRNNTHDASINYDLYYNRRFADMTMYPGEASPMYMVTWPDVGTFNTGIALADAITLATEHTLFLNTKWAIQSQHLHNEEGYKALKVFFPQMKQQYQQVIGRISANYEWAPRNWKISLGTGWGSRAATITEAYGYYLNNTYDRYDYIGNPHLKNESAIECNATIRYISAKKEHNWKYNIGIDANTFFFSNYIIGQFEQRISPMTVGAEGVKVYANIPHAHIINTQLSTQIETPRIHQILFRWTGNISYSQGKDNQGDNLPFIAPWTFTTSLNIEATKWSAQILWKGNARQNSYGWKYGERITAGYGILNISAQHLFNVSSHTITLRAGAENILDHDYTTYSDWNKLPQKGRNFYISFALKI